MQLQHLFYSQPCLCRHVPRSKSEKVHVLHLRVTTCCCSRHRRSNARQKWDLRGKRGQAALAGNRSGGWRDERDLRSASLCIIGSQLHSRPQPPTYQGVEPFTARVPISSFFILPHSCKHKRFKTVFFSPLSLSLRHLTKNKCQENHSETCAPQLHKVKQRIVHIFNRHTHITLYHKYVHIPITILQCDPSP